MLTATELNPLLRLESIAITLHDKQYIARASSSTYKSLVQYLSHMSRLNEHGSRSVRRDELPSTSASANWTSSEEQPGLGACATVLFESDCKP
jgi:hypothetical protein